MVPARPFFIGSPGWVRSICWLFRPESLALPAGSDKGRPRATFSANLYLGAASIHDRYAVADAHRLGVAGSNVAFGGLSPSVFVNTRITSPPKAGLPPRGRSRNRPSTPAARFPRAPDMFLRRIPVRNQPLVFNTATHAYQTRLLASSESSDFFCFSELSNFNAVWFSWLII